MGGVLSLSSERKTLFFFLNHVFISRYALQKLGTGNPLQSRVMI